MSFKVQRKKCDQCLFTDARIVSESRMKDVVQDCLDKDTFFVCHKTQVHALKESVCCRGYWDEYKNQFNLGRIAQRLGVVDEIELK